jgi:hypothetical protein
METVVHAGDARLLPHLPAALLRLLQEYPGVADGLSRSQRQALRAFAGEPRSLRDAYPDAHHAVEEAVWMGDWSFADLVAGLAGGPAPLLRLVDGGLPSADPREAMERHATLTDAGRDVLGGHADAVRTNGIDRWIGGVHLQGREVPWRWDDAAESIVER